MDTDEIVVTGLASDNFPGMQLVFFDIYYNDNIYNWFDYIPSGNDLTTYLNNKLVLYKKYIDSKELIWDATTKTQTIEDPILGTQTIDIQKNSIVRPPSHSYSILRNQNYPNISEYLDAKVKQTSTDPNIVLEGQQQETDYLNKCLNIKEQFPKDYI
jgi:hypothetical protein